MTLSICNDGLNALTAGIALELVQRENTGQLAAAKGCEAEIALRRAC